MPDKTNFAVLDALDFKIYLNPIKRSTARLNSAD